MSVDRDLFAQDAVDVAPRLLGALLRHGRVVLRIVEAVAYLAGADPRSHAFRRRIARNSTMFGPPGHLYAYFSYGMGGAGGGDEFSWRFWIPGDQIGRASCRERVF